MAHPVVASVIPGLARQHQPLPITESPDIVVGTIGNGSVKVKFKFAWKGPVDRPTEVSGTFTFEASAPDKGGGSPGGRGLPPPGTSR